MNSEDKYDDATIETVKELELDILKYVHKLCLDNNLKYYLVGGTLLGAIRHGGFIPWDDDIDIGMLREDYNKLREIIIGESNDKYFLQHYSTDPDYTRYITKIRVNGTKFIEKNLKNLDIHHGVFIDIFPLDRIYKEKSMCVEIRAITARILLKIYAIKSGHTTSEISYKTRIMKLLRIPLYIFPKKLLTFTVEWLYTCSNKPEYNLVTNFSSRYGYKKQTYPYEVFGEGTLITFENEKFIAPAHWEIVLKRLYGDYMKLPPENKRSSGHDVIQIDLGRYARK